MGYLVGPAVGGTLAEAFGFRALGLVPLVGALLVALAWVHGTRTSPRDAPS